MREAREVLRAALHPSLAHRAGAHRLWPPAPPHGAGVAGGDLSAMSRLHPREIRAAAAPAAREPSRAAEPPPPGRRGPGQACRSAHVPSPACEARPCTGAARHGVSVLRRAPSRHRAPPHAPGARAAAVLVVRAQLALFPSMYRCSPTCTSEPSSNSGSFHGL
jgi:hypothetical protein